MDRSAGRVVASSTALMRCLRLSLARVTAQNHRAARAVRDPDPDSDRSACTATTLARRIKVQVKVDEIERVRLGGHELAPSGRKMNAFRTGPATLHFPQDRHGFSATIES